MEKFTNLYTINKTLRFELKPYGKTLENFLKRGFLERDESKAKNRKLMQTIIDESFKLAIEDYLEGFSFELEELEAVFQGEQKEKDEAIARIKKSITNKFSEKAFKDNFLTTKTHIKRLSEKNPDEEIFKEFEGFTTYFTNFFDIRNHVFTGDSKGSIAFRIIDENLHTYKNNIDKLKKLPQDLLNELLDVSRINDLADYESFITQAGLTEYNEIIGGISSEDGKKIQGINEKINLYSQKNKVKLPRLSPLYKMILSDRITNSFVLESIDSDSELIEMLEFLFDITTLSDDLQLRDLGRIFIKYKQLGRLPGVPYSLISGLISEEYDIQFPNLNRKKNYENDKKKYIESQLYSIGFICSLLRNVEVDLVENLKNKFNELLDSYRLAKNDFMRIDWMSIENIRQSKNNKFIKAPLDALKDIQRFYDIFQIVEEINDPNPEFYLWLSKNQAELSNEFNSIYNKTRNYLTKKQYSTEKFKLNFDSPTLANGWDVNKEIDNSAMIFRKFNVERDDYDYYLGIWEKSIKTKEKVISLDSNGNFEKMEYKLFPDPSKMLPKLFLCTKWKNQYPWSDEFDSSYKNGEHKKGESFNKEFLHELIDHFKHGLINHENKYQEEFKFEFKDTEDYNAYTEFIQDTTNSNYKLSFNKVKGIDELINGGKLYLYQIWSKDFSTYSKGTKNLNTIYFESIFSEENLRLNRFKLSGEAELFYRPASLSYDEKTKELGHHHEELKDKFEYPIIKDRRYSEDKFFFHVPMQINFRPENLSAKELNNRVNENIDSFTHIIGIDRGERHLIYLSVVNIKTGEIVEQKHLDEIINTDTKGIAHKTSYLQKLEERSKARDTERKSWETIETIKELKEGYISQVVNEISLLQQKYNALIVMENLNYGFKNSRIKVEKQVYQKFELALIKKFNYIIDKKNPMTYLRGIQLTNPITTLDKIGSQSGIIFYIPAWNTSKIDPVTGFVNLINNSNLRYQNREQAEEFINKIDRIYFEDGVFKFDVDFTKWNPQYASSRTKWTLTSYGTRVRTYRNPEANNMWCSEEVDLTAEFDAILNRYNGELKTKDVPSYKKFMYLFKLMLQIRNSMTGTEVDYLLSPVVGENGCNFDSREVGLSLPEGLPHDADANGAYNIAKKGIMVVENIKSNVNSPCIISNTDYLEFMQKRI